MTTGATQEPLAIEGGAPVRSTMLPYARQSVTDADVAAVVDVLRSDWLTTGPKVAEFEAAIAAVAGTRHAVAVANGTAALHAITHALRIGAGDEVIVPALTFAATANAVLYQGGTPIFADVAPDTLLLDPTRVEELLTPRTKAIIAVDYGGQPCDYEALHALSDTRGITLAADACHSLGAEADGRPVGSLAVASAFSFHPVKPLTTGEGGAVTTDDDALASRIRRFRSHGIDTDHRERESRGSWFYEMVELGYNYRLTDLQSALGLAQLPRLFEWIERRCELARLYDEVFRDVPAIVPLRTRPRVTHAYHLYVILLDTERLAVGRAEIYAALRAEGIGVNVHYVPVHLHPYYRRQLRTRPGMCPIAEDAYGRMLSLPLFAGMTDADATDVIAAVQKVVGRYAV